MSDGMQLTRRKAIKVADAAAGKKIFGTKHSLSISEKAFTEMFQEVSSIKPADMRAVLMEVKRTMMVAVKLGATIHVPEWGVFRVFGSGMQVQGAAAEGTPISLQVNLLMDKSIKTAVATQGNVPYSIVDQAQIIPVVTSVKDLLSKTFDQTITPGGGLDIRGTNLKFDVTKTDEGAYLIPTDPAGTTVKFGESYDPEGVRLMLTVPLGLTSGTTYRLEIRACTKGTRSLRIGRYNPVLTVA